jgi:simple sugar transport system permease protein
VSRLEKFLRSRFAASLAAVLIGFAVAAIVLAAAGFDPAGSFAALFKGAFGKPKYIANVIIKATPILLTGVGVAFAFQTGLFNIGAPGQYLMGAMGALLISSLIIFPALSAMRVFRSFLSVTVCSAALSVACALAGMLIAIVGGTPVGSTIVAVDILVFFVFCGIEKFRK